MPRCANFIVSLCVTLVLAALSHGESPQPVWNASGKQGAVASGGTEATAAGLEMLRQGSNAADAAAATLLVLSVTDSGNFCFGGEVPIIVYDAQRQVVEVLSGQGAAPQLATREHFASKGGIPAGGIETAAVPAALDAILTLLDRYGTQTFERAAQPALGILDRGGKDWHPDLAVTLRRLIEEEKRSPNDRRRGLRLVADFFYRGPLARELDAWSRASGGLLRFNDFALHTTRVEEPVSVDYRGHTVCKCGPWTQGPFLLQSLRLLEPTEIKPLGHLSADYIHQVTEAMKLALADRDTYYGDPLFEDVPLAQLLSTGYTELRRPLIDPQRASLAYRPGDPRGGKATLESAGVPAGKSRPASDTTTCLTADRWGNVVAATPSGWGGVMAGKTGVQLGSRLKSLNTLADHPNCIQPGKRPRITLTPTVVLKDGQPCLAVSVAGGDLQDQVSLQLLLDCVDFGLSPAEAVTAPRFSTAHHVGSFNQPPPALGSLSVNEQVGEKTIADLAARGHRMQPVKSAIAAPCVLLLDASSGLKTAAGDPKAGRSAGAF